jgi:DNA-binding response OmpR family regulator
MLLANEILVIDDDAPIVELIVEALRDEGYAARPACDDASALRSVALRPPALILLDGTMPSSDERTLLEKLRSTCHLQVPIVVISAADYIAESVLAEGAADFLAKPFDLDDLLACVARYVPQPQPHTQ